MIHALNYFITHINTKLGNLKIFVCDICLNMKLYLSINQLNIK
jgi:hypothetical protein